MKSRLIIDASLGERVREVPRSGEKSAPVQTDWESPIAREVGKRLAALGGTQPAMAPIARRRTKPR